jgi:hypothetical protein
MYGDANLAMTKVDKPGRTGGEGGGGNAMVKLITVAPELQGVMGSIRKLKDAGFVVSMGHS